MRILIADDHEVVRWGVRSLLSTDPNLEVCGEAIDGHDAIEKSQKLSPDLILMDISMPKLDGLDSIREIRRTLPQIDILVLSQHDSPEMMWESFRAGARGYVVKSALAEDLLVGIDKVRQHQPFFAIRASAGGRAFDLNQILQHTEVLERALRESEHLFRLTFEQAAVGMAHVDLDGRWLRVNQKFCEIVGYTQEELHHLTFQDITYPDDLAADLAQAEQVMKGELEQYSMEKRYIRKDRNVVWVKLTVSAVRGPEGEVRYFIGVVEEISARKKTEERLRTSEARLNTEADALAKLNSLSARLWSIRNLDEGLNEILGAVTSELIGADKGNVQILDETKGVLKIAAHRGFSREFLDCFQEVSADDSSACGRALRLHQPVVVEDVETDAPYAPYRSIARSAGYRAVISVPMIGTDGAPIGMLSAHFAEVHRPTAHELRRLDLYVRQAANFIQRCRIEESLRKSDDHFQALAAELDSKVKTRTAELERRSAELFEQSEHIRDLSGQLLRAQDLERRRIARELHDSVGQILSVLGLNLAVVSMNGPDRVPETTKAIEDCQSLVKELIGEIRTMSYLLHPPMLDEWGLAEALRWYIQGLQERSRLNITLEIPADFKRPPSATELVIFRIVQEALTNIYRHSGSTVAIIRVVQGETFVSVEIEDRGKGIPPERLAKIQCHGSGVGIRGMRERVRQVQGEMMISSSRKGTKITARFPPSEVSLSGETKMLQLT